MQVSFPHATPPTAAKTTRPGPPGSSREVARWGGHGGRGRKKYP